MGIATASRSTVRYDTGSSVARADAIAVEAPLTIVLSGTDGPDTVLVTTMRTPGHDLDLAAGWLLAESGVRAASDIVAMGAFASTSNEDSDVAALHGHLQAGEADLRRPPVSRDLDTVRVALAAEVRPPRPRAFVTSSACGVCSADVIAAVPPPSAPLRSPGWMLRPAAVEPMLGTMREAQRAFERTGSLHAAAVASPDGTLLAVREDVGRHNAVDKAFGHVLLDGDGTHARVPLTDHLLLVSGRVSFEIVQKALAAGVAGVVAVSGPTTLAVDLAREHGLVLVGFAREGRLNVYSGPEQVAQ